jgi:capsular polysaccharide biosynthesis protein
MIINPLRIRNFLKLSILTTIGIMAYILFAGSCVPKTTISVDGYLFGNPIKTTVDNSLAELMITNPQNSRVLNLFNSFQQKPLNTETLSEIANEYSADVATFYFVQKSYQNKKNKEAQDLYAIYFENQTSNNSKIELETLREYLVVFVPGLAYKQDTTTGADFARQRRLLNLNGINNELIEIGEWDLVDDNATLIANRLKVLSETNEKIIVVSASKGGLETAIALGKILKPEETKSIKSWINVGGILRGTPIADSYLKFPKSWFAHTMLWIKGKSINVVQDMSYKSRKESFEQLQFPENIKIINFVGTPLATKISKEIKSRYCSMINLGPNDGLTPLADETIKNSIVISEVGLDHYFRDQDIDKKTLALAMVAVKIQE